jgi:glycosyltransferase involved in cell wall biosynthesis
VTRPSIRVLSLIESATVTGPSRNLIEFGKLAASPEPGLPAVEVIVATYQRGSSVCHLAVAAKDAGLAVCTISERRRWDTKVFRQLRQMIAECQPDILESRNVKSHFLVRMLGLHRRCRWVAWNHGYTATSWLDRTYTQLDRWSLRGAYRVVTVCGPFADKLVMRGIDRDKITILHNSVTPFVAPPLEQVQQVQHGLGLQDDEAVILAVGRLSYEKGTADLLRAAAVLNNMKGVPDFRIVLVGDGPERESLARLASQLGIRAKLTMAGFQRDTKPYYGVATLLAVPSHTEGSPNVVLEGMAAGLPIAATAVGGIPEILEQGVTGLLVLPQNPDAMADAIQRILTDPEIRQRLGVAARLRAESNFTPDAYKRSLVQFYQKTLEGRDFSGA